MKKEKLIELLRDDNFYYNGGGRDYVSVSHMEMINDTPDLYIKFLAGVYSSPKTAPMIIGGALHTLTLEKQEVFDSKYDVINIKGRGTKTFKEAQSDGIKLTAEEFGNIKRWVSILDAKASADEDIFNLMEDYLGEAEVPNTIQIHGVDWKGKADKVYNGVVYDLKTTSNLKKFKWSAYEYNYDAQAWLYSKMFNAEVKFIVIDKMNGKVSVMDCSDGFLNSGRDKIEETSMLYRDYIVPTIGGEDKISNIVNYMTL